MKIFRKECYYGFDIKADSDQRTITGYASTNDLDRTNDIVEPAAFAETMPEYMKNPIMFFGHDWWDKPIGKVIDYSIDSKGLWIKAQISETAQDVWQLIKEGVLKTFSIGFDILESEDIEDDEDDKQLKGLKGSYEIVRKRRRIKKVRLYEISVVNIPANPMALIESAKNLNIQLKSFNNAPDQPGANEEENNMDPELKKVQEQVGTLETNLESNIDTVEKARKTLSEIQTSVDELKDRPGGVTKTDLNAIKEKSQADLMEAVGKLNETIDSKIIVPPGMDHDLGSIEQAKRLGYTKDLDKPEVFKSRVIYKDHEKAATMLGMHNQKHVIEELQSKSDDLFIVGRLLNMHQGDGWTGDPRGLKTYNEYMALLTEVQKALDTATSATGGSFLPTGFSAILQAGIEQKRGVIAKMRRFPMPQTPYVYPLQTSRSTPYLYSEAISDNQVNTITASTPGTSNITFTAIGIATAVWNSRESEEDLIIPALSFIKEDIMNAMKNGEEYMIINGDNATTHQDTDHAAESAIVVAKGLDGLRLDAIANAASDASGTLTYALLVGLLDKAGKYGYAPGKGFFPTSMAAYYDILALTQVTGYDAFAGSAVVAKGALPRILGNEVIPTENMRQDLGPVGVNAASDNVHTAVMYVNPDGFLIGDRRNYTVEQATYPLTQQRVTVATQRLDMQKMVPSSDTPCSILYNITT